jgi:integrase/recombinase XerD
MIYIHISETIKNICLTKNLEFEINTEKNTNLIWRKSLIPFVVLLDNELKIIEEVYEYLKSKGLRNLKLNTLIAKGYDLKFFYLFLEQNKLNFDNLTVKNLDKFLEYLTYSDNVGLKLYATSIRQGKTINRIFSTIRDFYQYLHIYYKIDNPFKNEMLLLNKPHYRRDGLLAHIHQGNNLKSIFKVKESEKEIKVLTSLEYKTILNNLQFERDKLIFKFMFFTGARIGEILSLKIQNIKTFNAIKEIQTIQLSEEIENESPRRKLKTGLRKLFIPNWLYHELNKYYNTTWSKIWDKIEFDHNYFFISQGNRNFGFPLSYSSVNNTFKEISKKTKINFTAHDLRHTFATNLARNKVDISSIQKLLGHKNPSTCSIYIQLAKEEDIAKELEILYDKLEGEDNA